MTIYMWLASVAWLSIILGYTFRRRRGMHVTLMLTGIFLDIALVLFLQVTRSAVQKAIGMDYTVFQLAHIGCSTVALLLYFPTLYFGIRLFKTGDGSYRAKHQSVAKPALLFRSLGFIFMFSMWR